MSIFLLGLLIVMVIGMDVKATFLVTQDTLSEPHQRYIQLALVWLLPVLGAIIVFAVHRPMERHLGRYRDLPDPGDDFGFPRHSGRRSGSEDDGD